MNGVDGLGRVAIASEFVLAPDSAVASGVSAALISRPLKVIGPGAIENLLVTLPFDSVTALSFGVPVAMARPRSVVFVVAGAKAQASAYDLLVVTATGNAFV